MRAIPSLPQFHCSDVGMDATSKLGPSRKNALLLKNALRWYAGLTSVRKQIVAACRSACCCSVAYCPPDKSCCAQQEVGLWMGILEMNSPKESPHLGCCKQQCQAKAPLSLHLLLCMQGGDRCNSICGLTSSQVEVLGWRLGVFSRRIFWTGTRRLMF